ncbi:hypothetical protein ACWEQL_33415 [Kitasatospora sp. NPDC004240]
MMNYSRSRQAVLRRLLEPKESLGIVLRAQRAGDVVLSRPVFVSPAWAEHCTRTKGRVPDAEWLDRHW